MKGELKKYKKLKFMAEKEITEKIKNKIFRKHPIYPIIVNEDGTEIYDIAHNAKLYVVNGRGRLKCRIPYIGKRFVHVIVYEAWNNKEIFEGNDIHHKNFNRNDNNYRNLEELSKEKHREIHCKTGGSMVTERLVNRYNECNELYRKTGDVKYAMELDCIAHIMETSTIKRYREIVEFAKGGEFKRVFDIGCALGHQSEVFIGSGVKYIGINDSDREFWNADIFDYIVGRYPFKIGTHNHDLAVSILCLTWNCYLYEGEITLREQCEALARDFDHVILYMSEDKIEFVRKYFGRVERLKENLMYFSRN